jgi:hypothetical protein
VQRLLLTASLYFVLVFGAGFLFGPVRVFLAGLIALVFQQLADLAVGVLLRGMGATAVLVHFATPERLIYGALLVLFALMPWLVRSVTR